jgi:hypothetical protein
MSTGFGSELCGQLPQPLAQPESFVGLSSTYFLARQTKCPAAARTMLATIRFCIESDSGI